jgi:hypothetical protein
MQARPKGGAVGAAALGPKELGAPRWYVLCVALGRCNFLYTLGVWASIGALFLFLDADMQSRIGGDGSTLSLSKKEIAP